MDGMLAKANLLRSQQSSTQGMPVLNRNMAELAALTNLNSNMDFSDGAMLLSKSNFNVHEHNNNMKLAEEEIKNSNKGYPRGNFEPLGDTTLSEYLNHHHEMIVGTVINDTQRSTLKHASNLMHKRQAEDWKGEKMRLLHDLAGHREGQWAPAQAFNGNGGGANNVSYMNITNVSMNQTMQLNNTYLNNGGMNTPGGRSTVSFASPLNSMRNLTTLTDAQQQHAAVMAQIYLSDNRTPGADFATLAESLAPKNAVTSQSSASQAYPLAYRLIAAMFEGGGASSREQGAFMHLGNQYKNAKITPSVKLAAQTGLPFMGGNSNFSGLAQDISTFVEADSQQPNFGGDVQRRDPAVLVWQKVYIALRCFSYSAASEFLRQMGGPLEAEVYQPTIHLCQLLDDLQSNPSATVDLNSLRSARQSVQELYFRIKSRDSSPDPFKLAALNMLCLAENVLAASGTLVETIEDYLYAYLWGAFEGGVSNTADAGQEAIKKLGSKLVVWGPEYFQQEEENNAWAFAYPLLVAQQWETALGHLSKNGCLMEAAHLAFVLSREGAFTGDESGVRLVTKLLIDYSKNIQSQDPARALVYLAVLPQNVKEQVKRLLLETIKFSVPTLAGTLRDDGYREGPAALDEYFSNDAVCQLLFECAQESLNQRGGGFIDEAAELFKLAGRFVDYLRLLNRELVRRLADTGDAAGRRSWIERAIKFHAEHLPNGTRVRSLLDAQDNGSVRETFNLILILVEVVEFCKADRWHDAWGRLDALGLLPRTEAELSLRVENVQVRLDVSLKQNFHLVVMYGMESLVNLHAALKERQAYATRILSTVGDPDGTTQQGINDNDAKLQEIRKRARLLVTFAGYLTNVMSGDCMARMTRWEVSMV
jgi:hypothetical protein